MPCNAGYVHSPRSHPQNRAYTTSQISDLTEKLSKTENSIATRASVAALVPEALETKQSGSGSGGKGKSKDAVNSDSDGGKGKTDETPLSKVVKDSKKLTTECNHGLMYVPGPYDGVAPKGGG